MPVITKYQPDQFADDKRTIVFDIDLGYSIAIFLSFVFSGMFFVCTFLIVTNDRAVYAVTGIVWGALCVLLIVYRRFVEWLHTPPKARCLDDLI